MGSAQSVGDRAPLTREHAMHLAGVNWNDAFDEHFETPDAVIDYDVACKLFAESVPSPSTIVEWVPGVGPCSQVVANGRAKKKVSVCWLPAYFA